MSNSDPNPNPNPNADNPDETLTLYAGALAHSASPVTVWGERALFIFYFHNYLGKVRSGSG
jgi:hypothetical protein